MPQWRGLRGNAMQEPLDRIPNLRTRGKTSEDYPHAQPDGLAMHDVFILTCNPFEEGARTTIFTRGRSHSVNLKESTA